ncbi:hypothetical protein Tfer_2074 [Thermincola ferriacetica]|uniref:DUF4177 domain-containing protein n=1 Tax=Thermincola ferriacetica TaxID=281456 RepID=A0A0L6W121_9FIRM|nr:hypothetical protein [Thermincola ferriacetica]KNZ69277.1 hypothetical protein Tfer_2074 [Thermincola ferriacetica]
MAEYRVVEVARLDDCGDLGERESQIKEFETTLNEFCSVGWDIVSTKLLYTDNGSVRRALIVLAR